MNKEAEILVELICKLEKEYPDLILEAKEEFIEKEISEKEHLSQFFYGWFFSIFTISDGKNMPCLARESINLDDNEKQLLNNIQHGIIGLFRILRIKNKTFHLEDLLTKKEYYVKTRDLEHDLKAGHFIEANLVKNFDHELFFFGGLRQSHNSRIMELNLAEYSRDLDIEELVEREMLILENFSDEESIGDYLIEVLDFEYNEIPEFLNSDKRYKEEMIRDKIIEIESRETEADDADY